MAINVGRGSLTWETYQLLEEHRPMMRKIRFALPVSGGGAASQSEERTQNKLGFYLITSLRSGVNVNPATYEVSITVGDRNVTRGFVNASTVLSSGGVDEDLVDWDHPIVVPPGDLITVTTQGLIVPAVTGGIVATGFYIPEPWVPPMDYRETTWTQIAFPSAAGLATDDVTVPYDGMWFTASPGGVVALPLDMQISLFINDESRPVYASPLLGIDFPLEPAPTNLVYQPLETNDRIVVTVNRSAPFAPSFIFRLGKPWGVIQ